ncbi:MAG: transketolase [Candidatus Eremiobacteraeota bacterium]|nr:transketolase [Candidatus Eremiobacteraeota bacterium]MBV8432714.1 transketolase [Candidatus Eremiobacteraeota bacterium]MBV8656087.1 transketolase [Candidatus Eremiobacteraeota bacterium]
MPNSPADEQRINAIRFLAVDAVQKANSGHPGMPMGAAAMAYALWTRHLRFNPKDPHWLNRDRFVLSAGHGSMLLYALLYLTGYGLGLDDLKSFRQLGSRTPGHPEAERTPGVEATTGPLGQGIANAVGMAIAEAHLGAAYNRDDRPIVDHYTYCICGDGDLMEGISQEALSIAGHLKLGKLVLLYDDNKVSLAGPTDVTLTDDPVARFDASGWHTQFVDADHGNDVAALDAAIAVAKNVPDRPSFIAVRTHIGYGSPRQDNYTAHGEPLGPDNVKKAKELLGWPLEPDFYVPDDVLAFYRQCGAKGADLEAQWQQTYDAWKRENADLASTLERILAGKLPQNLPWPAFTAENGSVATRDAGGTVMNAIAKSLPELIGGSADLDPSTKTYLKDCGDFQPGNYAGRNVHYGVREHAMAAITNGITLHGGLLPFAATFFNFLDYCKPAVRLAALSELHDLFVFTHDSVFLGEDGPTHEPIEQLAILRAQPNTYVVRPADSLEVLEAWKLAIARKGAPWILVLTRQKVPFLGQRDAAVAKGAYVLNDAQNGRPDLILIATGSEVSLAVDAKKILEERGVATRVVSMPCWELFDQQERSYRDEVLPPAVGARMSIEAAATLGWAKYVGDRGFAFGIDHFGASAPAAAIAKAFGFTAENVAQLALDKFSLAVR